MTAAPTIADRDPDPAQLDPRPQVALPSGGMPTWVIGLVAVAIALVLMLALNAHRADRLRMATGAAYAPPAVPPLPPALAAGSARLLDRDDPAGPRVAADFRTPVRARYEGGAFDAPIDGPPPSAFATGIVRRPSAAGGSEGGPAGFRFATEPMPGAPGTGSMAGGRPMATGGSALVYDAAPGGGTTGFGDDKGAGVDGGAARASLIRNRPAIVAQGEILPATLETPVSSTRPGPIRAVVARDVRGFDGARVLIPRGSRLIGEYRADPAAGRRRVLATWTRLIRPDGVAIRIDSPAADALGGAGLPGRVDTHFLARFANAALQSALQIGVNLASRAGSGSVIVANTPQISSAMGQNIIPGADEPPTVTVAAGAAISVFVARDLDFTGVPAIR